MIDPISLVRENIRNLSPYSTARDEYSGPIGAYLDANENPYNNDLNRYPDPHQKALKERIAEIKNVSPESIFIGNGSDEAIDLALRIFCEPRIDNVVSISPTYGMYRVAAAINDVEVREVALDGEFELDTNALLAAADRHTKLIFVCSPNNPTGNSFRREDIELLLREFNGMVVLDEAYIDFAQEEGFLPYLERYPNLIILQTLSKAWGMAGLRLGLAYARRDIIGLFSRVKYPYNINVVTQRMVIEQLQNSVAEQVAEIVEQRKSVTEELSKNPLIKRIYPSDSNFILIKVDDPRGVYQELIRNQIIVRDRSQVAGCKGCLRITIGTPQENEKMLDVVGRMSEKTIRK